MVYVIADIHGKADDLNDLMSLIPWCSDDHIVVAGDVGLQYGNYKSEQLEAAMASYPCTFVVMRGNHDIRYERTAVEGGRGWCRLPDGMLGKHDVTNVKYVPDCGGVFNIDGKNILFIPGGHSADGWYRKAYGLPYEEQEELTYMEMVRLYDVADQAGYDYVVSHVAPYAIREQLSDLFVGGIDEKAVSHFTEKMCNYFYEKGGFKKWVFGHYHADRKFDGGLVMTYNIPVALG